MDGEHWYDEPKLAGKRPCAALESAEVLEQMDPSETPGTRASVDMGEVKVEADA